MIDFNSAADTAERLARDREALAFIATTFRELGSLTQAKEERERAAAQALLELESLHGKINDAQHELRNALAQAQQVVADAEETARTTREATVEACNEASRQSAERIAALEADAAQRQASQMEMHRDAVQIMRGQLETVTAQKKALEDTIAAKAVELSSLESRIHAAREAAAAILG